MMIRQDESRLKTQKAMWVVFSRGKLVVDAKSQMLPVAHLTELPFLSSYIDDIHQLPPLNESAHQELPVFVVDMGAEHLEAAEWERVSLRQLLVSAQDIAFSVIGRAWQYTHFLRTHQFCGQCGAKAERVDWEMAMHCHRCQHRSYPRVSPCVIVSIHNNEQILLAKGVRHKEANMYSTLAGFVESGESLEEAVHREIFEEVGVKVKNLRYFNSQPWPFPHSLMVGFIAEYAGGEIRCQENEIDDAQWFDIDRLPNIPPKVSIAGQLIAETVSLIGNK
ncbi:MULTISPECIES: NAD(+) diphosphatase [unclassified Alteromonas]|jgi:NAD+ diphosphatase|uniref:NAD(+) diphosphatase n=1 Tax=unclassified Alteromonas TaxID=2614992 RepID=UPI0019215477|nr:MULTISPECIES: NAD(+) diphosphatase [unclassified Alteromonas]WDT85824.1 NAD(+) diphosphatase [Alteromonas sp. 009811495]BCO20767.1 NADH pyrophosphatase [Alteromonas sp. KC3]BCO24736.1 NADH pyrophosphatase [Alteromonas sp. KC14]|tara:strand:+ start:325 stop:1158 length:834 start_codon:yes stop_codon:yes gene_type:complete